MTIIELRKVNTLLNQREIAIKFFCMPEVNENIRSWLADCIDEYTVELKKLGLEE